MATTDHEGYRKVQAWVPQELWDKIEALNIPNQTIAVTQALELLVGKSQDNPNSSPDIPELRARLEEKEKQLEDKDKHIETLKKELEDNKATHNNYMFQIQTLINQKAIDAPGTEKKKHWYKFW